jgi:hypothetical protein
MRLVPEKDQRDQKLRRMLAFRLQLDGEATTTAYLLTNIREVIRCAYHGSFFEFLRTDQQTRERRHPHNHPDPPTVA